MDYSRAAPSPRYKQLLAQYRTMHGQGDPARALDAVETFATGTRSAGDVDRVLATVMFTDVVDSTRILADRGDRAWRELLSRIYGVVRGELGRHRGSGAWLRPKMLTHSSSSFKRTKKTN